VTRILGLERESCNRELRRPHDQDLHNTLVKKIQSSVEAIYCRVNCHYSCRPAYIGFSCPGEFNRLLSVLNVVVDHKEASKCLNNIDRKSFHL
jgi:hypothetical protein